MLSLQLAYFTESALKFPPFHFGVADHFFVIFHCMDIP
jgi:hypothetical protein